MLYVCMEMKQMLEEKILSAEKELGNTEKVHLSVTGKRQGEVINDMEKILSGGWRIRFSGSRLLTRCHSRKRQGD